MKKIIVYFALISKAICVPRSNFISSPMNDITLPNVYNPIEVECPSGDEELSQEFKESYGEGWYTTHRRGKTNEALLEFFKKNLGQYSPEIFNDSNIAELTGNNEFTVALAFSGGGYRSIFTGAGQLVGLDSRSSKESPLSGILQASTFITGINEGNLLIGSLIGSGFPAVDYLFNSEFLSHFRNDLVTPYGEDMEKNKEYWKKINREVYEKHRSGFAITPIDILGRALSFQFLDPENRERPDRHTLSGVKNSKAFENFEVPYPLLTARGGYFLGGYGNDWVEAHLEMSPDQITSRGQATDRGVKTAYFGSQIDNGGRYCYNNLDDLGFLMAAGTSFKIPLIEKLYNFSLPNSPVSENTDKDDVANQFLSELEFEYSEIYPLIPPNIFGIEEFNTSTDTLYSGYSMEVMDDLPLSSLVKSDRDVDVIFLFDNTAEGDNGLPTFSAIINSIKDLETMKFPVRFPEYARWYSRNFDGAKSKPVFFGCDQKNKPLVIYIPNSYYTKDSLPSDDENIFSIEEMNDLMINGLAGVSQDNGNKKEDKWPICVACAMLRHQAIKNNHEYNLPDQCNSCFEKYCVEGFTNHEEKPKYSVMNRDT